MSPAELFFAVVIAILLGGQWVLLVELKKARWRERELLREILNVWKQYRATFPSTPQQSTETDWGKPVGKEKRDDT